jgi:putative phosphoesterase
LRIAVISDIHGNKEALDAVLDDISHQQVDQIICAGDFIDPLPESRIVWQQLKALSIPMIRGNHEDYIISVHLDGPNSPYNVLENWAPVRRTAKLFTTEEATELKKLPLKIFIPEVNALICHASPGSNKKGWNKGIDNEMAEGLSAEAAEIIVCGHWHMIREEQWQNKKLVMVGSVGVPLHGKPQAEYSIIEKLSGEWKIENRFVNFDHMSAAKKYVDSGFVADSLPISLLLLEEFKTNERYIAPFMAWKDSNPEGAHHFLEWPRSKLLGGPSKK